MLLWVKVTVALTSATQESQGQWACNAGDDENARWSKALQQSSVVLLCKPEGGTVQSEKQATNMLWIVFWHDISRVTIYFPEGINLSL